MNAYDFPAPSVPLGWRTLGRRVIRGSVFALVIGLVVGLTMGRPRPPETPADPDPGDDDYYGFPDYWRPDGPVRE